MRAMLDDRVAKLADEMAYSGPGAEYMLFLGEGCARAADLPTVEEMAGQVFDRLFKSEPERAERYLRHADRDDPQRLVDAFYKMLGDLPPTMRQSLLQSTYAGIPIPLFYQDLARLIKRDYFNRVLTTNIDTLLEQALSAEGMVRDYDYQVINLGEASRKGAGYSLLRTAGDGAPATIVKLHGDVAGFVSPDEIEAALRANRLALKGALAADTVMVGYRFESEPLNHWLARRWQPSNSFEEAVPAPLVV